MKSGLLKAGGNHAPAFEDEFGFGLHQACADFNHPLRSRQADRHTPGGAQFLHELGVREWIRRSQVDGAGNLFVFDQPAHSRNKILVVNPRDILATITRLAAQAKTDEAQQHIKDTVAIRTHHHGRAQENFAGMGCLGLRGCALPGFGNLDAEAPFCGRIRFVATDQAGALIVGGVVAMGVDRSRARLQPSLRRTRRCGDCNANRCR